MPRRSWRRRSPKPGALARFGMALGTDLATTSTETGFAIGEDQFNRRLHYEHALNATAPELWRYGMHLVEETEAELVRLAAAIAPGTAWRDLILRLRGEAPAAGDLVTAYREEVERSLAFVRAKDLVTVPEGPRWWNPRRPICVRSSPSPPTPRPDSIPTTGAGASM